MARPDHPQRRRAPALAATAWLAVVMLLGGCSSTPPHSPHDLCEVFREKPGWYRGAVTAERQWGLPLHVGMAFVYRESSYVADARPPRRRLLWVIPWVRASSAYGYAQATNAAWSDYQRDTRRRFADRDDLADALDFIGWYNHRSARHLGLRKDDAYHLYVAYYAGLTGYRRGGWRHDARIKGYARKVADRATRYRRQLGRCDGDLGGGFWRWFG